VTQTASAKNCKKALSAQNTAQTSHFYKVTLYYKARALFCQENIDLQSHILPKKCKSAGNGLFSRAAHTLAQPENTLPLIHLPDFLKKYVS